MKRQTMPPVTIKAQITLIFVVCYQTLVRGSEVTPEGGAWIEAGAKVVWYLLDMQSITDKGS